MTRPPAATTSIGTASIAAGSRQREIAVRMTHMAVTPRAMPLASAASVSARR